MARRGPRLGRLRWSDGRQTGARWRRRAAGSRIPADSRPDAFTIEHPSTLQFEADVATFRTDGVTSEVAEARGAGGPNGETNHFAGVAVRRGDDLLARIPCTGTVTSSWEALLQR